MLNVCGEGQKRIANAENNIAEATWEFAQEDVNFSLFGYFTSKDEHLRVKQHPQGNICFSLPVYIFQL